MGQLDRRGPFARRLAAHMGEVIAGVGKPTLFVMEGGYMVDDIGVNAVNVLLGFEGRV